jgi:hypothetical protein
MVHKEIGSFSRVSVRNLRTKETNRKRFARLATMRAYPQTLAGFEEVF